MAFNRFVENLIADFRELPVDFSRSKSKAVSSLSGLLQTLQTNYHFGEERIEEAIMRNWKDIVGNERAYRCSPERVVGESRLVIFVGNATLRNELQFDKARILKRLQDIPACHAIKEITFR